MRPFTLRRSKDAQRAAFIAGPLLFVAACAADPPPASSPTHPRPPQSASAPSTAAIVIANVEIEDVRSKFEAANTCPGARQAIVAAPYSAVGDRPAPTAEIASDPERLALWQKTQSDAARANARAQAEWSHYTVDGCGQRARYRCQNAFTQTFATGGQAKALCIPDFTQNVPADDSGDALFECITPESCPGTLEDRAKKRAATGFACSADQITTHERLTKGLSIRGSGMLFSPKGRAEFHIEPGQTGGTGFNVQGCGRSGIVACVPAHRTVMTSAKTYDNTNDTICVWATE